jgi:hypothetical protein
LKNARFARTMQQETHMGIRGKVALATVLSLFTEIESFTTFKRPTTRDWST